MHILRVSNAQNDDTIVQGRSKEDVFILRDTKWIPKTAIYFRIYFNDI